MIEFPGQQNQDSVNPEHTEQVDYKCVLHRVGFGEKRADCVNQRVVQERVVIQSLMEIDSTIIKPVSSFDHIIAAKKFSGEPAVLTKRKTLVHMINIVVAIRCIRQCKGEDAVIVIYDGFLHMKYKQNL